MVRWKTIVGVITAPLVNNPVAGILSGLFPWRATGGKARVNLANGDVGFKVEGLVLVGTNFSGTRGDLTEVKGTLVCNPGTNAQAVIDTACAIQHPRRRRVCWQSGQCADALCDMLILKCAPSYRLSAAAEATTPIEEANFAAADPGARIKLGSGPPPFDIGNIVRAAPWGGVRSPKSLRVFVVDDPNRSCCDPTVVCGQADQK